MSAVANAHEAMDPAREASVLNVEDGRPLHSRPELYIGRDPHDRGETARYGRPGKMGRSLPYTAGFDHGAPDLRRRIRGHGAERRNRDPMGFGPACGFDCFRSSQRDGRAA